MPSGPGHPYHPGRPVVPFATHRGDLW